MKIRVLACIVVLGCAPAPEPASPPAPPIELPGTIPAADWTFALPVSKDEVSIELHPRVRLEESTAESSDERTGLVATLLLTLPANRAAFRHADVGVAVKRRPGGEVELTRSASFEPDTPREGELTVPLGVLRNGAYDVEVHSVARVPVQDDDWTAMLDTKEATERVPLVLGAGPEQNKQFDFHFDSDTATPVAADKKTLDRTVKAIDALLAAHPDATARVDCWTSVEGDAARNRALAVRRCDWFKAQVWGRLSRATKDPLAAVPHSTTELTGEDRKRDLKIKARNRVARLQVRWMQ